MTARIHKTATEDRLPIGPHLEGELRRWLEHYTAAVHLGPTRLPPHARLVPTAHWEATNVWLPRGGGHVIYYPEGRMRHPELIVHRGLTSIGYEDVRGEGFHTLRRTCARLVYEMALADGTPNPIRLVQSLLGHQTQATTERYLGIEPERAKRDELLRRRSPIDACKPQHTAPKLN